MRLLLSIVVATGLINAPAVSPTPGQDSTTLTGVVLDNKSLPLANVMVYLDSASIVDWTDADGTFALTEVAVGEHRIHFRKGKWAPRSFEFSLPGTASGSVSIGTIFMDPGPEPAMSLTGLVRDARTAAGVPEADIFLNGRVLTQSTDDGRFEIPKSTVAWGSNLLTVRRMGYTLVTDVLWVGEPVTNVDVTVELQPTAIELPEVVVLGDRTIYEFGRMREFWQRRRRGFGRFLTREDIERRPAFNTSDLLLGVPGIVVHRVGSETRIRSTRFAGRQCPMNIYVDGLPMVGDMSIDAYTAPESIAGIEVYSGSSSIPPEFNRSSRGCGVIVIWTR